MQTCAQHESCVCTASKKANKSDGASRGGRPSQQKLQALLSQLRGEERPAAPPTTRAGRKAGGRTVELKLLELSVTIILAGQHLPLDMFLSLQEFLTLHTIAGLFGYEVGGQEANGHGQGVIR